MQFDWIICSIIGHLQQNDEQENKAVPIKTIGRCKMSSFSILLVSALCTLDEVSLATLTLRYDLPLLYFTFLKIYQSSSFLIAITSQKLPT